MASWNSKTVFQTEMAKTNAHRKRKAHTQTPTPTNSGGEEQNKTYKQNTGAMKTHRQLAQERKQNT